MEKETFPSELVSPKVKADKEYGLRMFRAMYSSAENQYYNLEDRKIRWIDNRSYSEGLQRVDKYKDLLDLEGDVSYLNIDWNPPPIIPKFVDIIAGEFSKQQYKVRCYAVDPQSRVKKDKERSEIYANMLLRDFSEQSEQITGIPVIKKDKFVAEDREEAELYMGMNFKQATEIAMETGIDWVYSSNKWDSKIKEEILRDLINIKYACGRVKYDANMNVKVRYVDPVRLIHPYVSNQDHSKLKYCAEKVDMTIEELRRESDLKEEELFEVAKFYQGENGNDKLEYDLYSYYSKYSYDNLPYNNFIISVLDGEFKSINLNKYEELDNPKGGFYFQKKAYNYKPPKNSKRDRNIHKMELVDVYEGMWIIGTDYIFNYGKRKNIPRKKTDGVYSPEASLSFFIVAPQMREMQSKSLVERMKPHADQMALAFFKLQALIAKARPPGASVDISAIEEMAFGEGNVLQPLEIQEIYDQTGVYYYRSRNEEGAIQNQQPIRELTNGIGADLEKIVFVYNQNLQMIRDATGINEFRDASTPDKDSLVGMGQMAISASNNATRPLLNAFHSLVEDMSEYICLMLQDLVEYKGEIEALSNPLGENNVRTITIGKDVPITEFGIRIEILPTAEEMQELNQWISICLEQQTIDPDDAMDIKEIAKQNIKLASHLLKKRKKQREQKQAEAAQANSEQTAQIQQQSSQAKAQGDIAVIQAKSQAKKEELTLEYKLKEELEQRNQARELQKIQETGKQKLLQIDEQALLPSKNVQK